MGLPGVDLNDTYDTILRETLPLLEAPEATSLSLDGDSVPGGLVTYRGFDFLFADLGPLVNRDFAVFRPSRPEKGSGWPEVRSTE